MNYFLLLKNELSLAFLRKFDNILSAVKAAIRLYASKEESQRKDIEALELQALEKIIKTQLNVAIIRDMPPAQIADLPGNPKTQAGAAEESKEPPLISQHVMEQITYEKIVGKLIEYNEKVNEGRELSIVEYLKRIDPRSPFMKEYDS
jgi:hypothetical protein